MELIWQVYFRKNRIIPSKLREARTLPNKASVKGLSTRFLRKLLFDPEIMKAKIEEVIDKLSTANPYNSKRLELC